MEIEISPAAKALEHDAEQALVRAQSYPVIASTGAYQSAESELSGLSATLKKLEAERTALKSPILDAGRRIDAFFKRPMDFLEDARKAIKTRMIEYQSELDRQRKEAERIAAEAARKERDRLEREAAKAEEDARRKRAEAEAKARALESAGKSERAEAARQASEESERARLARAEELRLAAATMPIAPVVHMEQPSAGKSSIRTTWDYEIADEKQIPREYLIVDTKAVGRVVKAMGGRTNITGVRVFEVKTVASRS